MSETETTACPACDLVHDLPLVLDRATIHCVRCGTELYRTKVDTVDRTIAWALAATVLFVVAVSFPFLGIRTSNVDRQTGLLTGIGELYDQGMVALALLVLVTCVIVPLLQMLSLLYVLIPLRMGRRARAAPLVFRLLRHSRPWGMMGVFMLGILVALVKLSEMATIVPGLAVFAFGVLIFAITFAITSLDPHYVWKRLEELSDG